MSDHGRQPGDGHHHGGFTTEEMSVQWLLAGAGVRPGVIDWPVSIMDGAPTLLHALGIEPPAQVYGRVVSPAFAGGRGRWHARASKSRTLSGRNASVAPRVCRGPACL